MLVKLKTYSLLGIEAVPVDVEVDVSRRGKDGVTIVGLPETVVKESTHRVSRAIENSGYTVPSHSILVNLAPADMPKQAASFDVPIALGMIAAGGEFDSDFFGDCAIVGELALDGSVRGCKGVLAMAMAAAVMKNSFRLMRKERSASAITSRLRFRGVISSPISFSRESWSVFG